MKPLRVAAGAFVVALAAAAIAWAAPSFPKLTGRVVDDAQILSPQTEQTLGQKLEGLERSTGRQLVVVTLPTLQGYEIEDYGYQLGRAWGLGSKDEDDGALLIVAPSERKVRIEVGYGLEPVLTDALSSVILQTQVLPRFRAGEMEAGVVAGADAVIEQLSLPEGEAKSRVEQAKAAPGHKASPLGAIITMVVIFWVLSSFMGAMFGHRGRGRRGRGNAASALWLLPLLLSSSGRHGGGSWGGGGGGGGFGGGGGSFGGGGASGGW